MIKITELKGNILKKELGFNKCSFRYHNKNKTGGNFGIDLVNGIFGNEDFKHFEISGDYNTTGEIIKLTFSCAYALGFKLDLTDFKGIISQIKRGLLDYDTWKEGLGIK